MLDCVIDSKMYRDNRYVQIFGQIDLSKNFYFSYSYDITQTLQSNMTRPSLKKKDRAPHNDMFMWNHYLWEEVKKDEGLSEDWILPVIYGFVDQASRWSIMYDRIVIY